MKLSLSTCKKNQSGYLLVEVLVSMVILLWGVVAIVKLQHVSKNSNAQATQRTIASNLSDSLVERIRSNTAGIDGYFPSDSIRVLTGNPTPPEVLCAAEIVCTPEQLAAFDLWQWEKNLSGANESVSGTATGGLVNPTVCLLREPGGGDGFYHIALAWHGQSMLESQAITDNANASNCGTSVADNAYDASGNDNVHRRIHWQEFYLDI